jgi:hypothetical protein
MKYVIAETWNGEGYSSENKAYIKDFLNENDVRVYIESLFPSNADILMDVNRVEYDVNDDAGSYEWHQYTGQYGVVILPQLNEVLLLDKDEFDTMYKDAVEQADPEEEIEQGDEVFIGAYSGEYDYMFIKLKP